jgi:exodeoxyribonuclease VII small subunit
MNEKQKTMTKEVSALSKQPFEKILHQIESIVAELENNELPLDEALKKFEEGVKLSRAGSARLEDAERRIGEILNDGTTVPVTVK